MNVLQILPALDAGGVERGTLEIADALVRAGHAATVMSAGGRLVNDLERLGARHLTLAIGKKSPSTILLMPKLRRLLASGEFDIVHVRSRLPAWITWLAWRGLPASQRPHLVTTVHGLNSVNVYSAVMLRGERVIVVSNTVRDYVLRNYAKTDPARITVIPRGIRGDDFPHGYQPTADWRARFVAEYPALAGDDPWLCLPGRGTRIKGHEHALRLIADLIRIGQPSRLVLLGARQSGRDHYTDSLIALAKSLGIIDRVVFTEPRRDVRDVFAASAAILQVSTKPEAFGRTVVEALNLGVPVIGFDHGGAGELLAELFPEGRVPLGDAGALVTVTRKILVDRPRVAPFDSYRLADMQRATLDVYRQLLDTHSTGRP